MCHQLNYCVSNQHFHWYHLINARAKVTESPNHSPAGSARWWMALCCPCILSILQHQLFQKTSLLLQDGMKTNTHSSLGSGAMSVRSALSEEKKFSIAALSQTSPERFIEQPVAAG